MSRESIIRVKPGDNLTRLVQDYYESDAHLTQKYLKQVLQDNPEIKDPNLIYPRQSIYMRSLSPVAPPLSPFEGPSISQAKGELEALPFEEFEMAMFLSQLADSAAGKITAGAVGTISNAFGTPLHRHQQAIKEVLSLYDQFKRGELTRGQYDYKRRILLQQNQRETGKLFSQLMLEGKTARQSIRMDPKGRAEAAKRIGYFKKYAKIAKGAGLILAASDVYFTCKKINKSHNVHTKNEAFIETAGSMSAAAGLGLAGIALVVVTGPLGLGAALLVGGASALLSYGAGLGAKYAYNEYGQHYDIVDKLAVDNMCGFLGN